jgi:hypothetical protein
MKFALELLHHVMKERIEAKTLLRKAAQAKRPGQLMKDITIEDLEILIAQMDDDEYLREVRIKLIGEGKLISTAVVTPIVPFPPLSSSAPSGAPPSQIAILPQLSRPDSPPSPSPTGRPTQSGKSLKTIAILQKQYAHEQEAEADEQEDEKEEEGKGEEENQELEVDEDEQEKLGEQQNEANDDDDEEWEEGKREEEDKEVGVGKDDEKLGEQQNEANEDDDDDEEEEEEEGKREEEDKEVEVDKDDEKLGQQRVEAEDEKEQPAEEVHDEDCQVEIHDQQYGKV